MHNKCIRRYHAPCSPTYHTQLFPSDIQHLQHHHDTHLLLHECTLLTLLSSEDEYHHGIKESHLGQEFSFFQLFFNMDAMDDEMMILNHEK